MAFQRVNGIVLHHRLVGAEGAPVLVFSNSLGTDLRIWDGVAALLAGRFRLLFYDSRGHGLSEETPAPTRMTDHVEDLAALLAHHGIAAATVVGLSVGGMIAQGLAALEPERVGRLVLIGTAHKIGTEDSWNARIAAVREGGIAAIADGVLQLWFTAAYRRDDNADFAGYRNMLLRSPVTGYVGTCAAVRDADLTEFDAGARRADADHGRRGGRLDAARAGAADRGADPRRRVPRHPRGRPHRLHRAGRRGGRADRRLCGRPRSRVTAMGQFISTRLVGDVAVVTIDNPPVNALSFRVRHPLMQRLETLRDEAHVRAIVLACAGRTFVAGADITEFGKPLQRPTLRDLVALLEAIGKPTVAAIHGTALGGGLELAMGCSFRVAARDARLGLPEVKLGLLPGAGGTIRLPALIGATRALGMIVSGSMIGAAEAQALGLVDAIAEGELVDAAVAFAEARLAEDTLAVPVRERRDKLEATDLDAFEAEAGRLAGKSRGLEAPLAAAQAVRNAVTLPFDQALAAERALFQRLEASEESQAQRHLFFAEREATKIAGLAKEAVARPLDRIGVVGAGTMGGGIALALAQAGLPATLVEISREALERGMAAVDRTLDASVSRGSLAEAERGRRRGLISGSTDFASLAGADLIIEAVFEDMAAKRTVFSGLDRIAKPGAVLASNTSYLDLDQIAAATGRPGDVVGLHFFSPAHVMRLIEVVRGAATAPDVLATALALAKRLGKVPVVVGVCHGFVGNRMLAARSAELEHLLLEGATPAGIDAAFADFGWPMGPFQMADLAGLDISWRNRRARGETAAIADALCEMGRFGQKTARGYYLYPDGPRNPVRDPEVERLIEDQSARHGIERRDIAAEEIVERTLYPMINEGAKILEEGIAQRSSDIDLVWVHGYGFPVGKGGPMFHAERLGLSHIVERLQAWHSRTERPQFDPSLLLLSLAALGGSFAAMPERRRRAEGLNGAI